MIDDANDPELDGKYLGTITKDFVRISDFLKEAAYQVRSRKISDFPIFPIAKGEQPIGSLLVEGDKKGLEWHYFISFLEEFQQRTLIGEENVAEFKRFYKDPEEFCCLFVIDGAFTRFVYVPYPDENS
ncbi:hypothetical protein A3SI_08211 [Nitritalea halalkaliphila LW7]|uniref:Uncharacterized protein n=1 Tax=Nitritalea halalkaliphila LW7 TaxID=1189621 RepID=I5C506_9BACT|nr:hypothetical protein [Nitritalea halalkaliphila]EIM76908.1 hypothetical protein A3SI_08211 [Nitritalea halalkaliphila LW7]